MTVQQPLVRCLAVANIVLGAAAFVAAAERGPLQIDDRNPRYWQYKGQPVLLLGGSKTDHIFLADGLKEHLDEIAAVGANYVRNTMSQREGVDLKPHRRLPGGKLLRPRRGPLRARLPVGPGLRQRVHLREPRVHDWLPRRRELRRG